MDGKIENKKYFIMNAKIYARRYATNCFSDYFNDMAKKSGAGLDDYREYRSGEQRNNCKAAEGELKQAGRIAMVYFCKSRYVIGFQRYIL